MEELGVARIAEPNFSFLTLHLKNQRPPSDLTEASDFFIGQRLFARRRAAIGGFVPDTFNVGVATVARQMERVAYRCSMTPPPVAAWRGVSNVPR